MTSNYLDVRILAFKIFDGVILSSSIDVNKLPLIMVDKITEHNLRTSDIEFQIFKYFFFIFKGTNCHRNPRCVSLTKSSYK